MPKTKKEATRRPLPEGPPPAPSILKEDAPTKPPLVQDVPVAESILEEGLPTKKPLLPSAETEPELAPE